MTTTQENVRLWSVTTGTANATTDGLIASSDAQSPDTVDNNIRSIMTSVKRQADDQGGWIVAGGTATALTATTASGITTAMLVNGLRLCVRTASAATGAATIAVDAATATTIKKQGGGAIAAGDWASGDILDLVYSSTATAFIAANISAPTAGSFGSALALFSARPSGDQVIATGSYTKISFQTEDFDVGSYFDAATNYRWTPPAGYIRLAAYVSVKNVTAGSVVGLKIFKNGTTIVKELTFPMTLAATGSAIYAGSIEAFDNPNGTDYYEIFIANSDTAYSVGQVAASFGSGNATWFMGHMI